MRWIVGDVQGCAREFEKLLRKIKFKRGRDELWSAGDLISRGPDSLATYRIWSDIGGRGVIGNHEANALLIHTGERSRKSAADLETILDAPDADEIFAKLRALPVIAKLESSGDGPDAWLVHAGLRKSWKDVGAAATRLNRGSHKNAWLASDDIRFALNVRCCDPSGELTDHKGPPKSAPKGERPWDSLWHGKGFVVHGHWAWRGYYRKKRTMGLDSGCVHGGPLTAWCQDEDRIVQVTH